MANTTIEGVSYDVTYTLTLTIVRPVHIIFEDDETPEDVMTWMRSHQAKRELEREVLRALRVVDGDCDVEVMGAI